jgi:hypothetical protein
MRAGHHGRGNEALTRMVRKGAPPGRTAYHLPQAICVVEAIYRTLPVQPGGCTLYSYSGMRLGEWRLATVTNLSGVEDADGVPKTYYLRIRAFGRTFYKIGLTERSIARRFCKEPATCVIEILRLWHHKTLLKAEAHEARLFRENKHVWKPYIGRVGPLRGGGNTEVFIYDVLGGEAQPTMMNVWCFDREGWKEEHAIYTDVDPYRCFSFKPRWVQRYYAPQTLSLLLPRESREDRIAVADFIMLEGAIKGTHRSNLPHKSVVAALDGGYIVNDYMSLAKTVREAVRKLRSDGDVRGGAISLR